MAPSQWRNKIIRYPFRWIVRNQSLMKLFIAENSRLLNQTTTLSVPNLPARVNGFEELTFLFNCNNFNRSIIRLDFDEAAYVYKVVRTLSSPTCIEIGRFKGGSTILIGSALMNGILISIDVEKRFDSDLMKSLASLGLLSRVKVEVADAGAYHTQGMKVDFLFIDGGHLYDDVKRDYEHWIDTVMTGGHILFHDATATREYATVILQVKKFVDDLAVDSRVVRKNEVGSLVHFIKK